MIDRLQQACYAYLKLWSGYTCEVYHENDFCWHFFMSVSILCWSYGRFFFTHRPHRSESKANLQAKAFFFSICFRL